MTDAITLRMELEARHAAEVERLNVELGQLYYAIAQWRIEETVWKERETELLRERDEARRELDEAIGEVKDWMRLTDQISPEIAAQHIAAQGSRIRGRALARLQRGAVSGGKQMTTDITREELRQFWELNRKCHEYTAASLAHRRIVRELFCGTRRQPWSLDDSQRQEVANQRLTRAREAFTEAELVELERT